MISNVPQLQTLSSFVGRQRELEQVAALLRRLDVRLLNLTGPGGTGKTRLALAVAATLAPDFPDGIYFIDLAPLRDPTLVLPAIAHACGIVEADEAALQQRLQEELAPLQRLLILDNFEQVVDAAPLVAGLLITCPRLKLLVTSRAVLRVPGEQEYGVPPLGLPDPALALAPEQLQAYDALRLFGERAASSAPGFALTGANAAAIADICARLEGLPLAIELAAARVRVLPLPLLLERLERRLPLLSGGGIARPERHRTLRAAIDWSYDLLTAQEQRLFRLLSVFEDGAALEAVEAMDRGIEAGELLDLLGALSERSLLRQETAEDGSPRFTMLETLREYGLERLEAAGEAATARRAHALYFAALVERSAQELDGPRLAYWFARLNRELANLLAALDFSSGPDGEIETGLRLAAGAARFWDRGGHWTPARRRLAALLAQPGGPPQLRQRVLNSLAILAQQQGDHSTAESVFQQALAEAVASENGPGILRAYLNLAVGYYRQTRLAESLQYMELALEAAHDYGQPREVALVLSNMGVTVMALRDFERARACYQEALPISRAAGDQFMVAMTLLNLAEVIWLQGDIARADALYGEALPIMRSLHDSLGTAVILLYHGLLAEQRQQYGAARARLDEALSLLRELDHQTGILASLIGFAALALDGGTSESAATLLGAVDSLRQQWHEYVEQIPTRLYERVSNAARAILGAARWEDAFATGKTLAPSAVYALATAPLPQAPRQEQQPTGHALSTELTAREIAVLRLVALGLSNIQVADRLNISINTVQTHLRSMYGKLDLPSRGALIRYALDHDLSA